MISDTNGQLLVMEREEIEDEAIETQGEPEAPPRGISPMTRYVLQVAWLIFMLYLLPFFMARSGFYEKRNLSFYSRPLNYAFETPVKDADVLLFGDSTALFGIDPSQMGAALGVTALNLPNTHGSLVVDNDLPLRRYLAKNRPPRLIVFYFAPWDFDYGHVNLDAIHIFEGEELLARQGTFREIFAFVRKKPVEGFLFPLRFYADSLQFLSHRISHEGQEETLARTHGYVDNVDVTTLAEPCTFPPLLLDNIRFSWVKDLAEKYRTPQTDVMFFVAPVPSCTNVDEVLHHDYAQLPAAPPAQMAPKDFVHDVRYIHPHMNTVPVLTGRLIDAVRPRLAARK